MGLPGAETSGSSRDGTVRGSVRCYGRAEIASVGVKAFGWAADREGCGYYRLAAPYQALRERFDDMDTLVDTTILLDDVRDCDVIVGQRLTKWSSSIWWQGSIVDGRCLVYELDDDLWNLHPTNPGYRVWEEPSIKAALTKNAEVATAVTVSTEHLAEVVGRLRPNGTDDVYVLPNYIDEALLAHERPRRDKLTVGWSGSATHIIDFDRVVAPLTRYFRKYPGTDMHFMSDLNYGPMIKKRDARHSGWTSGVDAFHRTIDFDIGIAPLAGHEFNLSKSHIRALEYAALGIPIVASDVGPYRDFVQHGVTGFLCRTDDDWWKALRLLTEDDAAREQMGRAARAQAAEHTIQGNAWRWRDVYQRILSGRPAPAEAKGYVEVPDLLSR